MKNLALVGLVIIILGAAGFIFISANKPTVQSPEPSPSAISTKSEPEETATAGTSGNYLEYSEDILAKTSGRRVLFFYANWCGTCRPTDTDFQTNVSKLPKDLTLIRVNYNDSDTDKTEKALAQKYGITYQHTFVQIDENGNEITKWNGGSVDKLLSEIQ